MFQWLTRELAEVREPKFHVIDGPADRKLRKAVETTELAAPKSYKEFVLTLGNAQLYRVDESIDDYHVEVLASMREAETHDGQPLLWIGAYRGHKAYFQPERMSGEKETPVFEWIAGPHSYLQEAAPGFRQWLETRCGQARKKYGKRRWAAIHRGPEPFTADERRIADARKKFRCKIVGIAKSGKVRFEVHNGSKTTLPYLSIGITSRDETFGGGAFLPVGTIRPGVTKVVEHDCYKNLLPPEEVVMYEYPELGPEDRDSFLEFREVKRRA